MGWEFVPQKCSPEKETKKKHRGLVPWAGTGSLTFRFTATVSPLLFVQGSFLGRRGRVGTPENWSRDLGGSSKETTLFVHHRAENKG